MALGQDDGLAAFAHHQICHAGPPVAQSAGTEGTERCILTDLLVSHHRPQVGVLIWGREAKESCSCPAWERGPGGKLGASTEAKVMLGLSYTYPQR